MSRFSHYDSDEERLPEGMVRIGYDADTEIYTYRDADGSYWEGPPGSRYGQLTKVSDGLPSHNDASPHDPFLPSHDDGENEDAPPPPYDDVSRGGAARGYMSLGMAGETQQPRSWRTELMPLLNFFLVIGLCLLLVFWFLYMRGGRWDGVCREGSVMYTIQKGDTCWDVAQRHHLSLAELMKANDGLDCSRLKVGGTMCLPKE